MFLVLFSLVLLSIHSVNVFSTELKFSMETQIVENKTVEMPLLRAMQNQSIDGVLAEDTTYQEVKMSKREVFDTSAVLLQQYIRPIALNLNRIGLSETWLFTQDFTIINGEVRRLNELDVTIQTNLAILRYTSLSLGAVLLLTLIHKQKEEK